MLTSFLKKSILLAFGIIILFSATSCNFGGDNDDDDDNQRQEQERDDD